MLWYYTPVHSFKLKERLAKKHFGDQNVIAVAVEVFYVQFIDRFVQLIHDLLYLIT
jgi:hypothetical protein